MSDLNPFENNISKTNLPWKLRIALLRSILFKGELPAFWKELDGHYKVGKGLADTLLNSIQNPIMTAKDYQKKWQIQKEEILKSDNQTYFTFFYRAMLQEIWLEKAPDKETREIAREIWQHQKNQSKNSDQSKEWIYSLDWLVGQPKNEPDDLLEKLKAMTLNPKQEKWLLGFAMSIKHSEVISGLWGRNELLSLDDELPVLGFASIFNNHELTEEILKKYPESHKEALKWNGLEKKLAEKIKKEKIHWYEQYTYNGFGPVWHATHWGSSQTLKHLVYHGANVQEFLNDGTNALYESVLYPNADTAKILADAGCYARQVYTQHKSPLAILIPKIKKNLEPFVRASWLDIFDSMLQNYDSIKFKKSKEREGVPDFGHEHVLLAYLVIEKQSEPLLLKKILELLNQKKINWPAWVTNTNGVKEFKTKYSILDACLDYEQDDYLSQLAGQGISLSQNLLYQMTVWGPKALKAWLDICLDADLALFLSAPPPPPPVGDDILETVIKNGKRLVWEDGEPIWLAALRGRNPGAALEHLLADGRVRQVMKDRDYLDIFNMAFLIGVNHQSKLFQVIMPYLEPFLQQKQQIAFMGMQNLLKKEGRNLSVLDELIEKKLIPLSAFIDNEQNTLTHWVVRKKDEVILDKLLKAEADFEIPNEKGETAIGWALKEWPEMHDKIIIMQAEKMKKTVSQQSKNISKNHKRL